MKNVIICSAFISALFLSSCSDNLREDNLENSSTNIISMKRTSNSEADSDFQYKANLNLEKINNHFSSLNPISAKSNNFDGYPDYYGGGFINDSGRLTVLIKGSVNRYKKNITDIIGNNEVDFLSCKNSYKELNNTMNELNNYKYNLNNENYSKNFKAFYLSDIENIVVVELEDMSELKQKEFKKYVRNSNSIIFKNSTGGLKFQELINPGDNVEKSNNKLGSMAFQVKRNSDGAIGFVSSGHVFSSNDDVYRNGTYVGSTSVSVVSGSVDASFILLHNYPTNNTTNLIGGVNNLSTSTSLPGVGTVVNLRGAMNQSSGKILSTNASNTASNGQFLTNLTTASYLSSDGDSGGIIYSYVSSTNTRYTVGVHLGQDLANGNIKYFSKAPNVLSALGVSRY